MQGTFGQRVGADLTPDALFDLLTDNHCLRFGFDLSLYTKLVDFYRAIYIGFDVPYFGADNDWTDVSPTLDGMIMTLKDLDWLHVEQRGVVVCVSNVPLASISIDELVQAWKYAIEDVWSQCAVTFALVLL